MVGATVLIADAEDRLLILHRTDNHLWGPPGGAVEPGEDVETAARREVKEETGLIVGEMQLFGVFSGPELFYEYPNGDQVYNVNIVYLTRDYNGEFAVEKEEASEMGWFAPDHLPGISPPLRPVIARWVEWVRENNRE
jgi:8-oxo-dGTP pyrophosphatase MutT (NUDIX family)